ncbi:uncharacterized protein [Solanum tuberosum]|uniref:uncharacterized protein n=1 Tax=Solanum tuberosum TaxID=4113 RepID=UPI00073A1275|nr:PREDICTED: uncharacterized protein LOC107059764 [Solanum tuberosum]
MESFDELHPSFAVDPRNVRLGLTSDGFQPFRNSKTSHSIWPVVLIPYNLPPWLCMKQENFILSMLIPGPNGPGDAIDTYLQPLIEELTEWWDVGIETYDASTRKNFKLHASLLWTINDFPAYGNLSGWSTKGKMACPCCNKDTASIRLTNCKKQCFMGHRCYLPLSHKWRNETKSFDGTQEKRPPPKMRSDHKISGLKSHDCHVLLQHLLPLALRGMLSKEVCEPLIELSIFFSVLGSKELKIDNLEHIEAQIPITLCKLEKLFPPSFFDVMEHLPVHLASEAKIAGPIHYRWMYPVERWLYFLKSLIGNRACPEGSIAEGYIAIECMTLCSRYLHRIDTKFNKPERNYDGGLKKCDGGLSIFCQSGKTLGAKTPYELKADELEQAHIYILKNCDEVLSYLEEFAQTHENARHLSDAEWNKQFIEWFKDRVAQLHKGDDSRMMEDLLSLSRGPTKYSTHSNGYVINGYRFHAEDYDRKLRTQNCGVVVLGENDKDSENLDYYGVLTDVIELQFVMDRRMVLFRLFYANDNSNKGWQVVMKTQPRDSFEIVEQMDDDIVELGSPSKRNEKELMRFKMKPIKTESEDSSTTKKSNLLWKTRGQGPKISTMSASLGMETMHKNALTLEKENMKSSIPSPACTNQVKQYTQEVKTSPKMKIAE